MIRTGLPASVNFVLALNARKDSVVSDNGEMSEIKTISLVCRDIGFLTRLSS